MNVTPIYYSAGYKEEGEEQSRPYNLSKLLYYIVKATPAEKRAVYVTTLNQDENMWKVDRNFLEKAEEEDFCFVEGENLAGYEGKITEIVLYKWNRDYPADVFFEVDLSKWRLEERKDFSGYSHEKITKEIYNRQGLL